MGAGPVPRPLHGALVAAAWLVRIGLLPSLSWLAPVMHGVVNRLRWGDDRGGMFVEVESVDGAGRPRQRTWHLLAEGRDGPRIPSMAVEAIVRSLLRGRLPAAGARPALCEVSLAQYEALFEKRTIFTGIREDVEGVEGAPLYRRILGPAWERLPAAVRDLHSVRSTSRFEGRCDVERGRHPLARLVAAVMGFPEPGPDRAIDVRFEVAGEGERWTRTIGGRTFSSLQSAGRGASEWLITERFGPVAVDMAVVVTDTGLRYVVRRWRAFGLPLPLRLAPRTVAVESTRDDRFAFDVAIELPFVGRIVRYAGVLVPTGSPGSRPS